LGEEFAIDKRVLAVVNPKAGQGRAGRKWPKQKTNITRPDWQLDEAFTTAPGDATRITRDAIRAGYDVVLAVGGDGTINEVANGFFDGDSLIRKSVHLGVLPAGSGGDFVRSFDQFEGCSRFERPNRFSVAYPIDLGRVAYTGVDGRQYIRYFVNVSDVGIGAETVKRVETGYKRLGGRLGFFSGTVVTMVVYRNIELEVSIDDYQAEGRYASIVIANGRYFGGGMEIAPLAKLSSGLFNVLSIGDLSRIELIANFLKVYQGTHLTHPGIDFREARTVRVRSEKAVALETDGEHMDILEATFTILPNAIELLT
jgi:diacylglycerol kinase (ATP)